MWATGFRVAKMNDVMIEKDNVIGQITKTAQKDLWPLMEGEAG